MSVKSDRWILRMCREQGMITPFEEKLVREIEGRRVISAGLSSYGYDLRLGAEQQKLAVNSGVWPLYRYDPRRVEKGEPPLVIDVPPGRAAVADYMRNEARFRMVERIDAQRFRELATAAREQAARRVALYEQMAQIVLPRSSGGAAGKEGQP